MYQHPDCCKYGCSANLAENTVRHALGCPQHRFAIDAAKPIPEPTNNIKSLALARAQKGQLPDHGPAMAALDLARDWIEESGQNPSHIIVFIARDHESGGDGIKFFQAGSYRPHAQAGMVFEGLDVLRSTGRIEYGN